MNDIIDLPWLLAAPGDFRARLKQAQADGLAAVDAMLWLAGHALDVSQLAQMGRAVDKCRDDLVRSARLRSVKVAVAGTHTLDVIVGALAGTALRHGLLLDVLKVGYGQGAQALLNPQSDLADYRPDFVLVALDEHALGLARPVLEEAAAKATVDAAVDHVLALRDAALANFGATAIVQTIAPRPEPLFGHRDIGQPGTVAWLIDRFNARLRETLCASDGLLVDTAAIAGTVGLWRWHDPLRWHDAKLPFSLDAVPLFADHVCRVLAAARGLSRKCLVLDLDNTLWSGVIGDDGVEGIKLGQGSAAGEAHLAVQAFAADLRQRGIVLAVCSKNEEAAALLPFQRHDEMLLREDHIAVFVANWTDKASNLRHIAERLNIGVDALVFLDDNPAERAQVRRELPTVAVPEVGDEPSDYVRLLAMAGYFEAVGFAEEDRLRAEMYQQNAQRSGALQKIGNYDEYLASLEMTCTIRPFDELGRTRISQLVNKSNQFNLTTRRYTVADIAAFEADPEAFTLQVRLADRFGDNGIISVVIFRKGPEEWVCDTWLMSCRVLGRRVEEAVLATVAHAAIAAGASRLAGEYLPTAKNVLVEKHFEKLGFDFAGDLPEGGTRWVLALDAFQPIDLPFRME